MNPMNDSDSFKNFLKYLLQNKYLFLFIFTIAIFFSNLYISTIKNKYVAHTYLEFENSTNTSNISNILPISIPSSSANVSKFDKATHFLYSYNFFQELIKNEDFLYQLVNFESFDIDSRSDFFIKPSKEIILDEKMTWRLFKRFQNFINISIDNNNIATFSVLHYSPNISQSWSKTILESLDKFIKEKEERKIYIKIDFYKQQFSENNISELNDSIISLLTEEIKKLSFMDSDDNYLYSIMDETSTPYLEVYPNRKQLLYGSCALIFLILNSIFLILFIFKINLLLKWGFFPIGIK